MEAQEIQESGGVNFPVLEIKDLKFVSSVHVSQKFGIPHDFLVDVIESLTAVVESNNDGISYYLHEVYAESKQDIGSIYNLSRDAAVKCLSFFDVRKEDVIIIKAALT